MQCFILVTYKYRKFSDYTTKLYSSKISLSKHQYMCTSPNTSDINFETLYNKNVMSSCTFVNKKVYVLFYK